MVPAYQPPSSDLIQTTQKSMLRPADCSCVGTFFSVKINANVMQVFTCNISFIKGSRGHTCLLYGVYFCNELKCQTKFQGLSWSYAQKVCRVGAGSTMSLAGFGENKRMENVPPPTFAQAFLNEWARSFTSWLITEMEICLSFYQSMRTEIRN